jgi:hypothetical protein
MSEAAPAKAIGNKEKHHGIEETDQEAKEGQEARTDEAAHNRSKYGRRSAR